MPRRSAAAANAASSEFVTRDEFEADDVTPVASSAVPKTEGQALWLTHDAYAAYKASHALARSTAAEVTVSDKADHVIKRKAFVQALVMYARLKKKG